MTDIHGTTADAALIRYLQARIAAILQDAGSVTEFDLIRSLQEDEQLRPFLATKLGDSLALYRSHFLVFHALYRLADELAQSQQALLEISPLAIRWCGYKAGQQSLAQPDGLRDYYLDWRNFTGLAAQDVDELLASFWVGMHRFENRDAALSELGLIDPVDDETIRKAYRQQVMQHHPDRGGSAEKIQSINAAMSLLGRRKNR